MSNRIEVGGAVVVANPKALLAGGFVMGDEQIVAKIVQKVGYLSEALALHNDVHAQQGGFRIARAAGGGDSGVHCANVQMQEQFAVKPRFGGTGEQADILHDFLSVDCGHLLSA